MHMQSLPRLALALAVAVAAASAVAAPSTETTRVEIGKHGTTEVVVLDDMKVGESRQLYSEAGTLVTAVRTQDAIELDIGGDKTRVTLPDADLSPEALADLIAQSGSGNGTPTIVRVQRAAGDVNASLAGKQRVVMIAGKDGAVETIDVDGASVHVDGDVLSVDGGKRVIVQRKRVVADDTP